MAEVAQRFFCHECTVEIPRVSPDYTCPTCNSGFIEELVAEDSGAETYSAGLEEPEHLLDLLMAVGGQGHRGARVRLPGLQTARQGHPGLSRILSSRAQPGPGDGLRLRAGLGPLGAQPEPPGMDTAAIDSVIHVLNNLAGINAGGGGMPRFHIIGPGARGGGALGAGGGFQLHGNPGDYAWGQGGLDAIITQMLNQMDGAGPPPMARDKIQSIPTVKISKEQIEKNQSCAVCWEDFTVGEDVKLLECEHCFHPGCILPWLELHGTCPVCRKQLNGAGGGGGQPTGDPLGGGEAEGRVEAGPQAPDTPSPAPGQTGFTGLTGLIQSALNQVFNPWHSRQSQGSSTDSNRHSQSSDSREGLPDTQPQTAPRSASNSTQPTEATRDSEEDETPAARRQRLDSEFVDLDFD